MEKNDIGKRLEGWTYISESVGFCWSVDTNKNQIGFLDCRFGIGGEEQIAITNSFHHLF